MQISTVAVTYGTLTVRVNEQPQVSQPNPFANGRTVVTPNTTINAEQTGGPIAIVGGSSLRMLVGGLNRIGVKPPASSPFSRRSRPPARCKPTSSSSRAAPQAQRKPRSPTMPPVTEADMTSIVRTLRNHAAVAAVTLALVSGVSHRTASRPRSPKPKPGRERASTERSMDADASRYCANVAPSIVEARIAWQTKRLAELDAQVRQRIADLEKAEASAREWIDQARRE